MKSINKFVALLLLALIAVPAAMGQGRKELRINEVMVQNDNSIVDEYGRHSAWIELVNPTHAPINISSIYLTDDLSNPQKYFNFTLTPGRDNFIAVYDADGVSLLDSVTVPASLIPDASYARASDASLPWEVRDNSSTIKAITPGGHNVIPVPNNKIAKFKKMDEKGGAMTIMAMAIVFAALLVLCLCFYLIKRIGGTKKTPAVEAPVAAPAPADTDAEIAAAIAVALELHTQSQGMKLTIRQNPASAWNNKISAMREIPTLKR